MSDNLENIIFRCIERYNAARYTERHGLVTSYDSKNYLAKVMFQPEGQESGWLPIETGHIGMGYGIAVGLYPGDGKQTGDQVICRYQEGDFECGKIVQRVHSDQDKPPEVKSGEMVMWTKFHQQGQQGQGGQGGSGGSSGSSSGGSSSQSQQQTTGNQQIWFRNDGSIQITDGNGASLHMDGKGNIHVNAANHTQNITGNKDSSVGGTRQDAVSGNWKAKAKPSNWAWLKVILAATQGNVVQDPVSPGSFTAPNGPLGGGGSSGGGGASGGF